jgi:hypothetical protein
MTEIGCSTIASMINCRERLRYLDRRLPNGLMDCRVKPGNDRFEYCCDQLPQRRLTCLNAFFAQSFGHENPISRPIPIAADLI